MMNIIVIGGSLGCFPIFQELAGDRLPPEDAAKGVKMVYSYVEAKKTVVLITDGASSVKF